jgi:hypothetical protein
MWRRRGSWLLTRTEAHASLTQLRLLAGPSEHLPAVVDALANSAAVAGRLTYLQIFDASLSPAAAPALARLVAGGALASLYIVYGNVVDDSPGAQLLCDALRGSRTLTTLGLLFSLSWHHPTTAAATLHLLAAVTAHPTLHTLDLHTATVPAQFAAAAGGALGALISANAPALTALDVSGWRLGNEGMRPLAAALSANTHLRSLDVRSNAVSAAFIEQQLRPAVEAHPLLRTPNATTFLFDDAFWSESSSDYSSDEEEEED